MGWIADKVRESIKKKSRVSSHPLNRASTIGHPCLRHLVFWRTRWQEAELPNLRLLLLYEEGRKQEKLVLQELQDAGIEVFQTQRDFFSPTLQLIGHIDGLIKCGQNVLPIEVKSVAPTTFHRVNSYQDMLKSPRFWEKMWAWQVQAYILLAEVKEIVLILKNKVSGDLKDISIPKDDDMIAAIERRCNIVNEAVREKRELEIPEELDEEVCKECPFLTVCGRDFVKQGDMLVIDDKELEELLDEREALYEAYKRYQEIDKIITERVKGQSVTICGNWLITGKWVKRKGYTVPEGEYWRKKIVKLNKKEGGYE